MVITWPQLIVAVGVVCAVLYFLVRQVERKEVEYHTKFTVDEESAEAAGRILQAHEERARNILRTVDAINTKVLRTPEQ